MLPRKREIRVVPRGFASKTIPSLDRRTVGEGEEDDGLRTQVVIKPVSSRLSVHTSMSENIVWHASKINNNDLRNCDRQGLYISFS